MERDNEEDNIDASLLAGKTKIDDVREKLKKLMIVCKESAPADDPTSSNSCIFIEDEPPESLNFLLSKELRENDASEQQGADKKRSRRGTRTRNRQKKNKYREPSEEDNEVINADESDDVVIEEVIINSEITDRAEGEAATRILNKPKSGSPTRATVKSSSNGTPAQSKRQTHHAFTPPPVALSFNSNSLLLLRLLFLTPQDRERLLIEEAKSCGILVPSPVNSELIVSKILAPLYYDVSWMTTCANTHELQAFIAEKSMRLQPKDYLPELSIATTYGNSTSSAQTATGYANSNHFDTPRGQRTNVFNKEVNGSNGKRSRKRKRKPYTFSAQVNEMLYGEIPARKDKVLNNCNSDMDDVSFLTKRNQTNLLKFTNYLVEKNIGYIIEGELRINQKNSQQAFVTNPTGDRDILIPTYMLRQCALHGDIVKAFAIKLDEAVVPPVAEDEDVIADDSDNKEALPAQQERIHGFVISIVEERHNRTCVGTLSAKESNRKHLKFIPRDIRVGKVKINRKHLPAELRNLDPNDEELTGKLYVAKITDSANGQLNGEIIRKIGNVGELKIENDAILLQNGLNPQPYSADIIKMLPPDDFEIPAEELAKREDLRKTCIFSIDPATARDLDDAVSCRPLENGNFEIGVHISDVSYFVEEKSRLDEIIKEKTTSVYMVDQVYHMLPERLCMLCSLLPGMDKLAFSVIWEISKDGQIRKTRFTRSVMNSCVKLAYEHAQMVIENPDKKFTADEFPEIHNGYTPEDIASVIKNLQIIALKLREKRFEKGALRIDQPKIRLQLDPVTQTPISYTSDNQKDSNRLIEDFMLLANQSVAEFTFEKFSEISILRNHLPPQQNLLSGLVSKLAAYDLKFDATSSKTIRESIVAIIKKSPNPEATATVVNILAARPMCRATYLCSDKVKSFELLWHYALSLPIYTHFTSPIRRYPDILVHRVLSAALNLTPAPTRSIKDLHTIIKTCNDMKFNAKNAGDESVNLYFIHYVKSQGTIVMKAAVFYISEYMLEVVLIDTGHQLKINYKSLKPEVNVAYHRNTKNPEVTVSPLTPNAFTPFNLCMFSECSVIIYVKKNQLHALLMPKKAESGLPTFEYSKLKKRTMKAGDGDHIADDDDTSSEEDE